MSPELWYSLIILAYKREPYGSASTLGDVDRTRRPTKVFCSHEWIEALPPSRQSSWDLEHERSVRSGERFNPRALEASVSAVRCTARLGSARGLAWQFQKRPPRTGEHVPRRPRHRGVSSSDQALRRAMAAPKARAQETGTLLAVHRTRRPNGPYSRVTAQDCRTVPLRDRPLRKSLPRGLRLQIDEHRSREPSRPRRDDRPAEGASRLGPRRIESPRRQPHAF